jgi:hypothetical protein
VQLFPVFGALCKEIDMRLVAYEPLYQLRFADTPFSPENDELGVRFLPFRFKECQFPFP